MSIFNLIWNTKKWLFSLLPTVQIGFLCGVKPISLGEIPLPKNNGGANEKTFINFVWKALSCEPLGLLTWLNKSFSPKENTGTRFALDRENKRSTEQHKTVNKSCWVQQIRKCKGFLIPIQECRICLVTFFEWQYWLCWWAYPVFRAIFANPFLSLRVNV